MLELIKNTRNSTQGTKGKSSSTGNATNSNTSSSDDDPKNKKKRRFTLKTIVKMSLNEN